MIFVPTLTTISDGQTNHFTPQLAHVLGIKIDIATVSVFPNNAVLHAVSYHSYFGPLFKIYKI